MCRLRRAICLTACMPWSTENSSRCAFPIRSASMRRVSTAVSMTPPRAGRDAAFGSPVAIELPGTRKGARAPNPWWSTSKFAHRRWPIEVVSAGKKCGMLQGPPTLVYDGDCGICRDWIGYWRELTGERVVYRPYQEAAPDFPTISPEAFQRAIQLIEPDGQVYSGAAATFRVLRHAPGRSAWWWCYVRLPGFAALSEWAYACFARRRGLLGRLTKILWGPTLRAERYTLVSWVFLRLLGAIYVAAFASLGVQILGLIGHAGILPLDDYLAAAHRTFGNSAYRILPSLFWVNSSDFALISGTVAGVLLGLLVIVNRWTRPALIGLFALYLSYVHAGQDFMSFQWDTLLLESGFLAIFLTGGSRIIVWLYRWLVFRYLFLAGVVKLLSGDPTWHDLTALQYHFLPPP